MNTDTKVNLSYDAFTGASKEMVELISLLLSNGQKNSEIATSVEFEAIPDKEFTVRCYEHMGIGLSTDGTVYVIVKYPSKFNATKEQLQECLEYRGNKVMTNAPESYYRSMVYLKDLMFRLGEVTFIHHIK
jgi:hypothetical protein